MSRIDPNTGLDWDDPQYIKITVVFEHADGSVVEAEIPKAMSPEWSTEWENEFDYFEDQKIPRGQKVKSMSLIFRPLADEETGAYGKTTYRKAKLSNE